MIYEFMTYCVACPTIDGYSPALLTHGKNVFHDRLNRNCIKIKTTSNTNRHRFCR